MKCNHCEVENKDDARFCADCGNELNRSESAPDARPCFNCGFDNPQEAKFCGTCGFGLRQHHQQKERQGLPPKQKKLKKKEKRVSTRLKWHPAMVVLVITGSVILLLALPYITGNPPVPQQRALPLNEQRSTDPMIELAVREIASQFVCSCGKCGEQALDTCTCDTAIQERQFIRNALQAGQTFDQVIVAVNSTFRWMKPEFAARYDTLANISTSKSLKKGAARNLRGEPGVSTKLAISRIPESLIPNASRSVASGNRIATKFHRDEIFSQFRCPCGQCGIDELKDCDCNHPRGAQEVKRFVDVKIAENKHSVHQVIALVEDQYGNRKY